jgi:SsrA-binding protein
VRRLLLHRQEIDKLYGETAVAGPHARDPEHLLEKRTLKAEIGVATGKVAHDKRADLKKRATDRETEREVSRFNRRHG